MLTWRPDLFQTWKKEKEGEERKEKEGGGRYLQTLVFFFSILLFHLKCVSNTDGNKGSFSQKNPGNCGVNHPAPQKLNTAWFWHYYCKEIWETEIGTSLLFQPIVEGEQELETFLLCVKIVRQRWVQKTT